MCLRSGPPGPEAGPRQACRAGAEPRLGHWEPCGAVLCPMLPPAGLRGVAWHPGLVDAEPAFPELGPGHEEPLCRTSEQVTGQQRALSRPVSPAGGKCRLPGLLGTSCLPVRSLCPEKSGQKSQVLALGPPTGVLGWALQQGAVLGSVALPAARLNPEAIHCQGARCAGARGGC